MPTRHDSSHKPQLHMFRSHNTLHGTMFSDQIIILFALCILLISDYNTDIMHIVHILHMYVYCTC